MEQGLWMILFPSVVPTVIFLYLVWCAIRLSRETDEAPPGSDGHEPRRWRLDPRRPRDPRRGPHAPAANPLPECPPGGRSHVLKPARARVVAPRH